MTVIIDGKTIETSGGTILQNARENGIYIPTLCFLEKINEPAACRMCLVEVKGMKGLQTACTTSVRDGMEVVTDTPAIRQARKTNLEIIFADHITDCTECARGHDCELRELSMEYGADDRAYGEGNREAIVDSSSPFLIRDNSKCILCRRCVAVCKNVQGIGAIGVNFKGKSTRIGFLLPTAESGCIGCGQCVTVCPTGALSEADDTAKAWKAIFAKNTSAVAVVSPYVCAQIGELFGEKAGTDCSGKTAAMLRKIGFEKVYLCGKDVELCPAWKTYLEKNHPEELDKQCGGATPWERFAEKYRADREGKLHITAFTPCLAAKGTEGSVDAALTTRELATMWKRACVSSFTAMSEWTKLQNESFDEAPFETEKKTYRYFAEGLAAAEKLLSCGDLAGMTVLACPGGCAMGGGSPNVCEKDRFGIDVKKLRTDALIKEE